MILVLAKIGATRTGMILVLSKVDATRTDASGFIFVDNGCPYEVAGVKQPRDENTKCTTSTSSCIGAHTIDNPDEYLWFGEKDLVTILLIQSIHFNGHIPV